jgi:hypothetical protein
MQIANSACKVLNRETDYLLQQHQKLFEPLQQISKGLWSTACKFSKIRKELHAVFN